MSYHFLVSSPRVGHHNYRLITPHDQEQSPQYERLLTRLDQQVRNRLGPISEVYESELILAIAYDAKQLKGRLGREVLILCAEHEPSARPQLLAALEALKPMVDELIKRSEVIEQGEHTNLIYSDWLSTQLQELPALQALAPNEMLLSQLTKFLTPPSQTSANPSRKLKLSSWLNPKALAVIAAGIALTMIALWLSQEPPTSSTHTIPEFAPPPTKPSPFDLTIEKKTEKKNSTSIPR